MPTHLCQADCRAAQQLAASWVLSHKHHKRALAPPPLNLQPARTGERINGGGSGAGWAAGGLTAAHACMHGNYCLHSRPAGGMQLLTGSHSLPAMHKRAHLSACVMTGTASGGRPDRRAASAAATSACRSSRCCRLSSAAACLLSRAASTCRCQSVAERGWPTRPSRQPPGQPPPSDLLLCGARLKACGAWGAESRGSTVGRHVAGA